MDHMQGRVYKPSYGSGKPFCFAVLPLAFDNLYQRVGSIVIVVLPQGWIQDFGRGGGGGSN